jgi:biotin carboxylase
MSQPGSTLAGRRLLILGAGHYQIPVIRRAKALGCHVITLDYLPRNPGHALADDHAIVSTVDLPGVLQVARERRIDGVLTYGSDVSAPAVAHVAEALGLPGHPAASVARLQRKDLFRALQRSAGLPHPAFVAADTADGLERAAAEAGLPWPLVVKPADSSGSKGQTVVDAVDRLDAAFDLARPFARCGVVLAETFLPGDTLELVGEVFFEAGRLAFRQYGHNYFLEGADARVPVGELVPSLVSDAVERHLDDQLQALADAAGLRTGCLNFDGILSRGVPYLVDIGIRNGGNYLDDLMVLAGSFDFTDAAIYAALGAAYPHWRPHANPLRTVVSYILNARRSGTFDRVEIGDAIRDWVERLELFVAPGDPVEPYLRGDRTLGIALLALPDRQTALDLLPRMPQHIQVHVT